MLIEFPHFEGYLLEHGRENLLKKGKDFMKKKFVKHIHAFSGNEWDVYVESERPGVPGYTVRIRIQGGKVTHRNCNCLGFRFNPLCKHIVAALCAIRAEDLYDSDIGEYEAEETEEEDEMEIEKGNAQKKSIEKKTTEDKIEEEPERASKEKDKGKSLEKEEEKKSPQKKEVAKKKRTVRTQKDLIDRELECQTCRDTVKDPITLPCQAHSICLKCAESLLEKGKKDKDGSKDLICPSCGKKEGVIKVKTIKDLKSNRELERVRHAYDKEKENWLKEKERLEKELNELRNPSQKQQGGDKEESGRIDEEESLQKNLQGADSEKLKEVTNAAFYKLKNDGESMEELIEELKDNKKKVEKSTEKKNNARQKKDTDTEKESTAYQDDQIQIKASDKTPKKGKGRANGGKKGKEQGQDESKKKAMPDRGRKGALKKKENEGVDDNAGENTVGKRGRKTESIDKENASVEGGDRYELRTKKVKTYAE